MSHPHTDTELVSSLTALCLVNEQGPVGSFSRSAVAGAAYNERGRPIGWPPEGLSTVQAMLLTSRPSATAATAEFGRAISNLPFTLIL